MNLTRAQAFAELAKLREYVDNFEKELYHAFEKGNQQENGLGQHLGIPQRGNLQSHGKEIRQGESQQASCGGGYGAEAAEQAGQVDPHLDSWKYEAKPSFGLAEVKGEGMVCGLDHDLLYYISGPMTGKEEHNKPLFNEVARRMRMSSYSVINPADISEVIGHNLERARYLRADIRALCDCTAILMLPDWEYSNGAFLEFTIARELRMPIYYWSRHDSI